MGFEPHRWKGEAKALLGRFFGLTRLVLLVPFINTSTTRGTPANQLNTSNKEVAVRWEVCQQRSPIGGVEKGRTERAIEVICDGKCFFIVVGGSRSHLDL